MIRIVIADDHAVFRQGLAALIGGVADFELVGQAGDGIELEQVVADMRPDVAVVDVSMPRHDVVRLAQDWRSRGWSTRLVALTQHREPAIVKPILLAGVSAFVLKESAFEDLEHAIRGVMAGREFISPTLVRELAFGTEVADEQLAARELQVLQLVARGFINKQIAKQLGISAGTVRTHRNRLMQKLNLHNAADLTRYAIERGLLD
jgi:DNA-binding NarL/FixJ family response regulator